MHIGVLGASGATGRLVVQQGLDRGWTVTAVVRNLESMKDFQHANLKAVSCLGPCGFRRLLPWTNVSIYSQSATCIVAAMRKNEIRRLVLITASCTQASAQNSVQLEWVVLATVYAIRRDFVRLEEYLTGEDCKDMDNTVVKPTILTYGPATDGEMRAMEGQYAGGYFISRADVARFMLDCLTTDQ